MRKQFQRLLSALIVVVMVLAMLPMGTLAATEEYTVTPLDAVPEAGTPFVIYAPAAGVAMGSEAAGGKTPGYAVTTNEENATLKIPAGPGMYYLEKATGGYYLVCGGKYYTATSTSAAKFADSPEKGSKWTIEKLGDGYKIANTDYFRSGQPACIEVYGGAFSPWGFDATNETIFTLKFYAVDASADADGDGYIGTKPVAGEKPADGQKVVIYNEAGNAAFGAQSDDETAPSLNAIEYGTTGNGPDWGNGSLIFTVHFDGTYYTFENNGKYLRTSENEGEENAECLYFDTEENDYTKWTLEECTGGYIVYNKTAKYKGGAVCIEYFSNSFSCYTYKGSNIFAMKFAVVEDPNGLGYILNPKMHIAGEDAYVGVDYTFTATLDEIARVADMTMTYALDNGEAKTLVPTAVDGNTYSYVVPGAELAGKSVLTLKGTATNGYGMVYGDEKTATIKDEPLINSVSPLPNAATGSEKRPEITANISNCGANPTVTMTVDETAVTPTVTDTKISYKPMEAMSEGRHAVAVTIKRTDGKTVSMSWSFFVGESGMSLYFGQMHSHTSEYSDGAGTLEQAYEYAMNTAKDVDFLIVTDHSNYFDTKDSATTSSYYDLSSLSKSGSITKWEEAKQTAAEYNAQRDDFIAAYGYEMTWSGGPGHTNTFNTYGTVSRNNSSLNNKTDYAGMHLYNDLMVNANRGLDVNGEAVAEGVKTKYIEEAPVVSQLNHPGTTFGTFDSYAGYTPSRDTVINLIEVGNGEGQVGGSSYWPSYSEYDKCLAKGWHVAPTNNQDNHKGKWGDANTCRDVILTDNFTEAGLYQAMSERRVYATEDQNLRIFYYLNDAVMGTILSGDEEYKEVNILASVSDPDGEKLGRIEVIGENGISLYSADTNGSTYELKVTLPNTDAYYYIKVTQADGDIAVTAPVWIGEATPITASIKTDTALSVVGQSEKVTFSVANAADADYTLTKVELILSANGKETVVKTIDKTTVVAAGTTWTETTEYIRTVAGEQELKVVFYGTYQGKQFNCQASMNQKVYDASSLVKVAIDKGHDNYYVSGDYADSVGTFVQYCADNGVQVDFIEAGEFTYENLKNYKMVVLTVNYRRNTAKAVDYTPEEIEALQKYAAKGGNLIIASKSDRDNTYDNCADNSNLLLEAIGANVRVVDGIIVDNDMKANEAYRIYFSDKANFNTEHRFTAGTYTASNAFGTVPAPDNSTGFQLYNAAPISINAGAEGKVETLVRGYRSTWGASYAENFNGSSYVPNYESDKVTAEMGDVNIMTYEQLSGGGWLVVSGCTFFSNYDIKDDQDYANKFILQNILRDLTGGNDETVTSIAKVKTKTEGEYTIEGYITSNASGYDQDTAFFDCIYVQDKNGNGINVFPVAGNYCIGMNVRVHGGITFYCGEVELNLSPAYNGSLRIVSDEIYVIKPADVDCKTAMADASIGNLMRVKGIVTGLHRTEGVIDKIYVRDAAGEACLFINGYIMKNYTGLDDLAIGMMVSGVGIGSRDVDETSATSAIFSRLRVRDRSEIKILDSGIHADLLFDDVTQKDWFYSVVQYAVSHELLLGTSATEFEPESTLTRAMAVTVLYRLAGKPATDAKASFKDVPANEWYADAVAWAQATGVVGGYEDNTFRPDQKISREEMAVMLARYAKLTGTDVTPKGDLSKYPDNGSVASWAKDAVIWCVDNGIINGSDGKLEPQGDATRAQFAAIISRFDQLKNA